MRKFLIWILQLSIFSIIIGFTGVGYLFYINSKDLPSYEQLEVYQPPIVTRFYASDGKLLEEYAKEHRLFLPITDIPMKLRNAFISAEDKNFYTNSGIDPNGILRAAIKNIISSSQGKKSLVGGSTITQQVVKNFLLTKEKSINRKIKEAILSFRITKVFSKNKILELYLNEIFLGSRSYGIASAALNYFNKSVNELNLEEMAFLASLPQAPGYYNPHKNIDRILSRRNWVLGRMYEDEYISKEEALNAIKQPIKLFNRDRAEVAKADFFAEAVRQKVAQIYGDKSLYEGGLMVRTSLNPELEKIGEKALKNGLINYDQRHGYRGPVAKITINEDWSNKLAEINPHAININPWLYAVILEVSDKQIKIGFSDKKIDEINIQASSWALAGKNLTKLFTAGDVIVVEKNSDKKGYNIKQVPKVNGALVAMDPHNGRVLAMVGGYSFDSSKFNRATQAYRQPGSSFKPFVYLAALENNYSPTSIFQDSPIEISQGPGLPAWKPKNYYNDFKGPLTLRRSLELSRNPPTVRVAQAVGLKKVAEVAQRFGICENPPLYYSMVLGAMETTPLKLINAYAVIANGGHKVTPSLIDKIQDRNGKLVYSNDQRICVDCTAEEGKIPYIENNQPYVTDPRSAYQLTSILEGVVQHTKSSLPVRNLNRTIAGKTGTTNDSKDTWYIGFTSDLVVGVYVGFDDPKSLGKHDSGAAVSQPIFAEFMQAALLNVPDKPFKMPAGLKLVKVDYMTGELTTSPYGSFYEVMKQANYHSEIKLEKIDFNDGKKDSSQINREEAPIDLNDIQDEGIY